MENRIKRLRIWITSLKGTIFVDRENASREICGKLEQDSHYKNASNVLLFSSLKDEVNTEMFVKNALSSGKNVFLPCCEKKSGNMMIGKIGPDDKLSLGAYGIYEPKTENCSHSCPADIEVVVLPGIAFDLKGNRIGRGKGYYDRFLKKIDKRVFRIGVAFDFQLLNDIGGREHDEPVNLILTEKRTIRIV